MAKEKLTIQVAEVNRVEVHNMDFAEAGEEKVLEQLAADTSRADQEDAGLEKSERISISSWKDTGRRPCQRLRFKTWEALTSRMRLDRVPRERFR